MSRRYPESILEKLRQRAGLDEDDDSQDERFQAMAPGLVLDEVCEWEGLLGGYGDTLRSWIRDIYGIDLDEVYTTTYRG